MRFLARRSLAVAPASALLFTLACRGSVGPTNGVDDGASDDGDPDDDGDTDGDGSGGQPVAPPKDAPVCAGLSAKDLVPPAARLRRLTRQELVAALARLGATSADVTASLVDDAVTGSSSRNVELLTTTGAMYEGYWEAVKAAVPQVLTKIRQAIACPAESDECLKKALAHAMETAWRRRPSDADLTDQVAALAAQKDFTFADKLETGLRRVLLSPRTLYFQEGPAAGSTTSGLAKLTGYQAAEQLAFAIWHEPPDGALMDLAASGKLLEPAVWAEEVNRVLDDPRARTGVGAFFQEWFRYDAVLSSNKDAKLFPSFGDELKKDMLTDTSRTLEHLFFQSKGTPADLLTSATGFPSERLATFVDAGGSGGPIDVRGRTGVMTHPAMLTAFSKLAATGPITRARIFFDDVLCQKIPDPPPEAQAAAAKLEEDPGKSMRARIETLTKAASCQSCHRLLDPVAFSLEGYDPVGRLRDRDDVGATVDTKVTLRDFAGVSGTFDGFAALTKAIATTDTAAGCFATRFARYVTARASDEGTNCKVLVDMNGGKGAPGSMRDRVRRYFLGASFLQRSVNL